MLSVWLWLAVLVPAASAQVMDLTIALDISGSLLTTGDFADLKTFSQLLVDRFNVAPDATRVAAVVYNEAPPAGQTAVGFDFLAGTTGAQVKQLLGNLQIPINFLSGRPGFSMQFIRENLYLPERGYRGAAPVVVLVTDGPTSETQEKLTTEAQALEAAGGALFALGIRTAVLDQLTLLAGSTGQARVVNSLRTIDPALLDLIANFATAHAAPPTSTTTTTTTTTTPTSTPTTTATSTPTTTTTPPTTTTTPPTTTTTPPTTTTTPPTTSTTTTTASTTPTVPPASTTTTPTTTPTTTTTQSVEEVGNDDKTASFPLGVVIGVVVAILLIVIIIIVVFAVRNRMDRGTYEVEEDIGLEDDDEMMWDNAVRVPAPEDNNSQLSWEDLRQATPDSVDRRRPSMAAPPAYRPSRANSGADQDTTPGDTTTGTAGEASEPADIQPYESPRASAHLDNAPPSVPPDDEPQS
mgnify:CR=1 FL=1